MPSTKHILLELETAAEILTNCTGATYRIEYYRTLRRNSPVYRHAYALVKDGQAVAEAPGPTALAQIVFPMRDLAQACNEDLTRTLVTALRNRLALRAQISADDVDDLLVQRQELARILQVSALPYRPPSLLTRVIALYRREPMPNSVCPRCDNLGGCEWEEPTPDHAAHPGVTRCAICGHSYNA